MNYKCPYCNSDDTYLYIKLRDEFLTKEEFEIHKCKYCDLLFTTPRPTPDEISKYYDSKEYISHNDQQKGIVPWIYNKVKKTNIRYKYKVATKDLKKPRILDFGCGIGDFLHYTQRKGCEIAGCDVNENARKIASEKLNIPIVTPEEMFENNTEPFDVITMWHVLEHIDDMKNIAQKLHTLIKPHGRLVVAAPNYKSYDAQYYKHLWAAYDVPRHLNHFCKQSIESVLYDFFQYDKKLPMKWDAYYISMLSEKYAGNKNAFINGLLTGWKSNRNAKKTGFYSSLIYIFHEHDFGAI